MKPAVDLAIVIRSMDLVCTVDIMGRNSLLFVPKREIKLMQAYCVKCRAKKEMKGAKAITMKNGPGYVVSLIKQTG